MSEKQKEKGPWILNGQIIEDFAGKLYQATYSFYWGEKQREIAGKHPEVMPAVHSEVGFNEPLMQCILFEALVASGHLKKIEPNFCALSVRDRETRTALTSLIPLTEETTSPPEGSDA